MTKEAKGYEAIGMKLEDYLKRYEPDNWVEPLGEVFSIPIITEKVAKTFTESYNNSSLQNTLENQSNTFYQNPYVKEGIIEFYNKKLHEE